MTRLLIVVGAGGFGREVLDVVEAINADSPQERLDVLGVVDDAPAPANIRRLEERGIPCLGNVSSCLSLPYSYEYVIGVGSPRLRRSLATRLERGSGSPMTLVHPMATVGRCTTIGAGGVLCAGARLSNNVRLGRHVHVNPNATIGHDSVVGSFVSLNPLSALSGDCVVGDDVLVGVAGVLLNGITVRDGATVGASACVTRDVDRDAVVVGVPARPSGDSSLRRVAGA